MPEILTLLSCLTFDLNSTSLKHLSCIIQAMLAMNGRVTMLGISRWAGKGGSYRTIQRFFYSPQNWRFRAVTEQYCVGSYGTFDETTTQSSVSWT